MTTLKQALANYFWGQTQWRQQKAEEYPDDHRNARSALGLEELAQWVQGLDDTDPRLRTLAALDWWHEGDEVFPVGEESGRVASRYRFDLEDESPDRFLARFIQACVEDALQQEAE